MSKFSWPTVVLKDLDRAHTLFQAKNSRTFRTLLRNNFFNDNFTTSYSQHENNKLSTFAPAETTNCENSGQHSIIRKQILISLLKKPRRSLYLILNAHLISRNKCWEYTLLGLAGYTRSKLHHKNVLICTYLKHETANSQNSNFL